jgi:hypothetical protein
MAEKIHDNEKGFFSPLSPPPRRFLLRSSVGLACVASGGNFSSPSRDENSSKQRRE